MSKSQLDLKQYLLNTITNIRIGIEGQALHDIWMSDDSKVLSLCKGEKDSDGSLVYTAYVLWIDPTIRGHKIYRSVLDFLRFYAQKQGFKRFVIQSSRLDKLKGYQRGIGKRFKLRNVIFVEDF